MFKILRSFPDLIPADLEERCDYKERFGTKEWAYKDLLQVIESVAIGWTQSNVRFCFFIDGLDENNREQDDIIRLLKRMASSGNIKICVSSRPWNDFDDAFGQDPSRKLIMQDLNYPDIKRFVNDKLLAD